MKRYRLPMELGTFADFPDLPRRLRELAALAAPEGWQFKSTISGSTGSALGALSMYLRSVYRRHAEGYARARDQAEEDASIYFDRRFASFHTGLYTAGGRAIYMAFTRNHPGAAGNLYSFRTLLTEDDWWISSLETRPQPPAYQAAPCAAAYHPDWPMEIEYSRMLRDREMREHLPESLQTLGAFERSVKAAMSAVRKKAEQSPGYAARVAWMGGVEYVLPLFLNGWSVPDMAVLLRPEPDKTYTGHRLLLPEAAYMGARLLGPIQAGWMRVLVVPSPAPAQRP